MRTGTTPEAEARDGPALFAVLRPDPRDGRGKRVYLTDAGREAREACIAVALRIFAELDGGSLSEDLLAALPALRALRAALDRERDGARASARRSGSDDSES